MPEGLVRTTGGRFVRAPLIVVNPDLVEGPGDIGRPRVRRDNPADRQEVPGTGDTFVYQYRVPEDVKLQPIDVEGNIDQRIGGLMLERMKRENALDDLLAQGHLMDPQARLARRHMLTLGLRILELDRLYGPNAVLAYVLTYLTARELKMVIEKYDDPLSPGSVSLLPSVIDILQGGFRALTHMTWDEVSVTCRNKFYCYVLLIHVCLSRTGRRHAP